MTYDYRNNQSVPVHPPAEHAGADGEELSESDAPLKLLVVDRKGSFAHDIERAARALEEVPKVVVLSRPTRMLEQVDLEAPDAILVAPEEMTTAGLRRLAQVHRASPKVVIALSQGETPVSMTEAAASGASQVLTYPASTVKLRNALQRILDAAEVLRTERVVIREVPPPAPAPAPVQAPVGTAMVFTVTSPTGGCGKTFFATNMAAYLAGATGGRVLLVDLDLQFGEVSLALGLRPQRTIAELVNEESILEALPHYVMDHDAGYKVLAAPADPFAAELVGPREATEVLEAARTLYDYVVVDTPPSLNEVVLAAFDQSRHLVVMATMDVPSLRNLKVFLETIERLKLPVDDVSCLLNKAEPDNGIDLDELLRVYPRGFASVLPYSKAVSRSLNAGKPVLMLDPRADISQKLLETGAKLVPASEVTNPAWGASAAARPGWTARRKDRKGPATPPPAAAGPAQAAPAQAGRSAPRPAAPHEPGGPPAAPVAVRPPAATGPAQKGPAPQLAATQPAASRNWLGRLVGRKDRPAAAPAAAPARGATRTTAAASVARGSQTGLAARDARNTPASPARRTPPSEGPVGSRKEPGR